MAHVSRHAPVRKVSEKILENLVDLVAIKGLSQERKEFLRELLTPTERIMLSKRVAIIFMLTRGHSFDVIQETLCVSPSTIARLWSAVQKGKYTAIIRRFEQSKRKDFSLLSFLLDIIPPMHMSKKQYIERMRRLGI